MEFEKFIQDIKQSLIYTTALKTENETLHTKITSLENHVHSLESLIKDKDHTITELMNNVNTNENITLDKIIQLQTDQTLREKFRKLNEEHKELERKFEENEQFHNSYVIELKIEGEEREKEMRGEEEKRVGLLRSEYEDKIGKLEEEVRQLAVSLQTSEQQRDEDKVKVQKEYEEKLVVLQRSSSASVNVDIYKRKLAAMKMESMREIERLKQQLQHLQQGNKRRKY